MSFVLKDCFNILLGGCYVANQDQLLAPGRKYKYVPVWQYPKSKIYTIICAQPPQEWECEETPVSMYISD